MQSVKDLLVLQQEFKKLKSLVRKKEACRWIPEKNLHLTLHFLGEQDESVIEALTSKMESVSEVLAFQQIFNKPMAFPKRNQARVAGMGSDRDVSEMVMLYNKLANILKGLGLATERRSYRPHITLVRFRQPVRLLEDELESWANLRRVCLEVSYVTLFESLLSSQGAEYQILKQFPLARSD